MSAPPDPVVAVHGQLLPGSAGGIETNLLGLLRSLAARKDSGRQVVVGPGGSSDWLRAYLGPRQSLVPWRPIHYEAHPRPRLVPRAAWRTLTRRAPGIGRLWPGRPVPEQEREGLALTRVLRDSGVEVVHFPYQRLFDTDLPFVFEPWDLQHRHLPDLFDAEEIALREDLYARGCARARRVVVASEWTRRDLVAQLHVPPEKIVVIRRGARPPGRVWPARDEARRRLAGWGLPGRFALYPAKTWPHKNHLRLLEALAILRSRGTPVPLVCTGGSIEPHGARVRDAQVRLGLEDLVSFRGHVAEDELAALYRCADMLVFPSLFEGLGLPVLEALEADLPVVCSTAACLPEIVGSAGLLFDATDVDAMAEAMRDAWCSAERRDAIRIAGRARLDAFSWSLAAAAFVDCYRQCSKA